MQWIIALDFPILSECSSLSNELDRKRIDRLGLVRARIFTRRVRRFYRKFEIVTIHLIFANVRNTRTLKLYVLTLSDRNKFLVRFHFFDYRRKATISHEHSIRSSTRYSLETIVANSQLCLATKWLRILSLYI